MSYMLDTQMLIWAASDPDRLSQRARHVLLSEPLLWLSVVCIWEIALKRRSKHASFAGEPDDFVEWANDNGMLWVPVKADHTLAAHRLPLLHTDPFDRMLVAQASVEELTLLTADKVIARYPGSVELVS